MTGSHAGGLSLIRSNPQGGDAPVYELFDGSGLNTDISVTSRVSEGEKIERLTLRGATLTKLRQTYSTSTAELSASTDLPDLRIYDRIVEPTSGGFESFDPTQIEDLAGAMTSGATGGHEPDAGIPAIYTYFGQFLAHDVSRMKLTAGDDTTLSLPTNRNSHTLDFETLFGLTDNVTSGDHVAENVCGAWLGPVYGSTAPHYADLPRKMSGEPVCPDDRSDANLAVAQLHVLLARFHRMRCSADPAMSVSSHKTETVKFLQSVVLFDYLKRIICRDVYDDVMAYGRRIIARAPPSPTTAFKIPIEFAAACFRFGHSMVRPTYPRFRVQGVSTDLGPLFNYTYAHDSPDSQLSAPPRRLPSGWRADWPTLTGTVFPAITAQPISTKLTGKLGNLEPRFLPEHEQANANFSLPKKTLERGIELKLPSAQVLHATFASTFGTSVPVPPLLGEDALKGDLTAPIHEHTPLWFYTLREAENNGGKLGPLTGRVVMETLHAAIEFAPTSIISTPEPGAAPIYETIANKDDYTLVAIVSAVH